METATRIVRTVEIDVDREAAWELVGTEAGLARWLGGDVRLDPVIGGALRVVDDDGRTRTGRVLDVEAGRSLRFSWSGDDGDGASSVTLAVEVDDDAVTRVTVTEERAGGAIAARLDAGAAWDDRLLHLELCSLGGVPAFAGGRGARGDLLV